MELKQVRLPGKQVVQAYREDGFIVNGRRFAGAVLVLAETTLAWRVTDLATLEAADFTPLAASEPPFDLVLLGTGAAPALLPGWLQAELRAMRLKVEAMATPAACRTYNVLIAENRLVAAALLPLQLPGMLPHGGKASG